MEIHLEKCVSLRQIVGHQGDTPREVCQPQTNSRLSGMLIVERLERWKQEIKIGYGHLLPA